MVSDMERIAALALALLLSACAEHHDHYAAPCASDAGVALDAAPAVDAGWCGTDGDFCSDGDPDTVDQCWGGVCGGCLQGAACTITTYEGVWSYEGGTREFPNCVQRSAPAGTPCVHPDGEAGRCNGVNQICRRITAP